MSSHAISALSSHSAQLNGVAAPEAPRKFWGWFCVARCHVVEIALVL
jgi:hypothetical protein